MSRVADQLKELIAKYPLPQNWRVPEIFDEELSLDALKLPLAGLSVKGPNGLEVTGSAAGQEDPAVRCFFELLERVAIVDAESRASEACVTRDAAGSPFVARTFAEVFPQSPEPALWRYAKSNGVAAHVSWKRACESALFELIERDRLLRSWYGETTPRLLTARVPELPEALSKRYDLKAYLFEGDERDAAIHVVGVFGFPKSAELPRIYGLGSRPDPFGALAAATRECLQGFGFLYGEAVPTDLPPFVPHPLYHQEAFLLPDGIEKVRAWLAGDHRRFGRPPLERPRAKIEFADLTPEAYRGRLHVVKALSDVALPLAFGEKTPPVWSDLPRALWLHPLS